MPLKWNKIDFRVQETKRFMGLQNYQDGVERANLLDQHDVE